MQMTLAFLFLVALSCALIYPAYLASRRRGDESRLLVVAPVPAVVVWGAVTATGFGAQSLSNIVEVFAVFGLGVVLAYVKVFIVDKTPGEARASTYWLVGLLVASALILRVTMPILPE